MCNHWLMYLSVILPVCVCVCLCVWDCSVCDFVYVIYLSVYAGIWYLSGYMSASLNTPQYDHQHTYYIILWAAMVTLFSYVLVALPHRSLFVFCKNCTNWFVCFFCARFWPAFIGLCLYMLLREATPTKSDLRIPSDSTGFSQTLSDSVEFGQIWSDSVGFWFLLNLAGFGWILIFVEFGRTLSDSVGFGRTWLDLVDSVRWGRILMLVNLVRLAWSDFVGYCRI